VSDTLIQIPEYEYLRSLSTGSSSTVVLARHRTLDRLAVVKFIKQTADQMVAGESDQFRREAQFAAQVRHPNIVTVFDAGTLDGQFYLVMEYIDGGNLRERLKPGMPMAMGEIKRIVSQVAGALSELHRRGIIHCDLKPENILFRKDGTAMLSDFGVSTLTSPNQPTEAFGTLGYVAPEQQYRLPFDERADLYALASVVFEMLTGKRPLGLIKPPSNVNPRLSSDVDDVIIKALADDPDRRFKSIEDFANVIAAMPIARPVSLKRAKMVAVSCAGLLVALGGYFVAANAFTTSTYVDANADAVSQTSPPQPIENQHDELMQADVSAVPRQPESVTDTAQDDETDVTLQKLEELTFKELRSEARKRSLTGYSKLRKADLIQFLLDGQPPVSLPPKWTTSVEEDRIGRRYRWYVSPEGKRFRKLPDWAVVKDESSQ